MNTTGKPADELEALDKVRNHRDCGYLTGVTMVRVDTADETAETGQQWSSDQVLPLLRIAQVRLQPRCNS
jgi:hypothetical protein